MDVIKKLDDLRLERGMSVYRLAELSGLSQSTLANSFSRKIQPSIKNLELILATLGVSMSQFFAEGEQQMILSTKEIQMIKNYRVLPAEVRDSLAETINFLPKLMR